MLHPDTGVVVACDFCGGEPKCIEACPEEALDVVTSDEAAEKRFTDAMDKLLGETERLTEAVKKKDFKPMLAEAKTRHESQRETRST